MSKRITVRTQRDLIYWLTSPGECTLRVPTKDKRGPFLFHPDDNHWEYLWVSEKTFLRLLELGAIEKIREFRGTHDYWYSEYVLTKERPS